MAQHAFGMTAVSGSVRRTMCSRLRRWRWRRGEARPISCRERRVGRRRRARRVAAKRASGTTGGYQPAAGQHLSRPAGPADGRTRLPRPCSARLRHDVRYADDFVILCRTREAADAALDEVRAWVSKAGLTLHPTKPHVGGRVEDARFQHDRISGQGFEFVMRDACSGASVMLHCLVGASPAHRRSRPM